jgi:hydroxyacylglutathione hydrolase
MKFTQYYLDCLSQASYLIGDETTGRAVVVDPRRDIAEYLADAEAAGLTIELVIDTHFHADFLSGHLELAAATGATIAYGEAANPDYEIRRLADGERISLGQVTLEILATPGHTPESISIVVYERPDDEVPYGVLTGDALFIGDVGRPDLLASVGVTADELAAQLYHSVQHKLAKLPPATRVFPAHGAGSACGKNLSTETQSTIAEQLETNYALAPMTQEQFIEVVTEGQLTAPGYFGFNAALNKADRALLDETEPPAPLTLDAVLEASGAGAVVLDTRDPGEFAAGHLVGSINVGLDGRFAEYVGSVVSPEQAIVLVAEPGTEVEAKMRLGRIGFDNVTGHLADPYPTMADHPDQVVRASRLTAIELRSDREAVDGLVLVDIRGPGEVQLGTIDGALTIPLTELTSRIGELDPDRPTVVFCAGGYRSSIGASLLRQAGFIDVSDLLGGYGAWSNLVHAPA